MRSIEIVKTVAQMGTVSAAATELGISQPALTKKIQNIESAIGLKLFSRAAKGVKLTSDGEFFLLQGAQFIGHAQELNNRLKAYRHGDGGELRIGTKIGMDDLFFTDVVLKFIEKSPSALVEVDIDTTPSLLNRLATGQLDLVLVARGYLDDQGRDWVHNPNIEFFDLCDLPFDFVLRAEHPIFTENLPIEDVFKFPLCCPKGPADVMNFVAKAQKDVGANYPCPNILIDDFGPVFRVVEKTDHWVGVPQAARSSIARTSSLRYIPADGLVPPLRIGYAFRKHWDPIPSALILIELIKQSAANLSIIQSPNAEARLHRPNDR